MEFRRKDEEEEAAVAYKPPPPIRESAFPRPLLSPTSSLLSPRGGGTRNGGIGSLSSNPTSSIHSADRHPAPVGASSPRVIGGGNGGGGGSKSAAAAADADADEAIRYRECLRNHAASLGGHVVDGCGEFMPGSPEALKCAACGCHRSFHRKEDGDAGGEPNPLRANPSSFYGLHNGAHERIPLLLPPPHPINPPPPPTPHHYHHHHHHHKQFASPPFVGFGGSISPSGGAATESSSEERNVGAGAAAPPQRPFAAASKKRFRTKFTAEQKQKMLAFAETVGWRIQRQDGAAVEEFCAEVGISRQVLKVWMHNNKHNIKRQQQQQQQQQEEDEEEVAMRKD